MIYYSMQESTAPTLEVIPNIVGCSRSINGVFPATNKGIQALRVYAQHFVRGCEMIQNGEASLYAFKGPEPIPLPFDMNLNYIDINNAKKLDKTQLQRAITIMSQHDSGDIINAQDWYDPEQDDWREAEFSSNLDYSKEQLINILSSILITLGPIVKLEHADFDINEQVVVTVPVKMQKVDPSFLFDETDNPIDGFVNKHGQKVVGRMDSDEEEGDEEDEFGMSGDWWKEDLTDIIDVITEDPDINE